MHIAVQNMVVFGSILVGLLGCGAVESTQTADARVTDATPGNTSCNPLAPFGAPQVLPGLPPALAPADAGLSADELTLYVTQTAPAGDRDIFRASRTSITAPFGTPVAVTPVNSTAEDSTASISSDGLTLFLHSARVANEGAHLFVATRTSALAEFEAASPLGGVASADVTRNDIEPFLTADGQELWFVSDRTGATRDIYRVTKSGASFANPIPVPELNSADVELHPIVSADRLTVYFASNRVITGAKGGFDIYRSQRSTINDGFPPPTLVPELNTTANDNPRWLSADNCRLYLHSNIGGTFTVYVATREPS